MARIVQEGDLGYQYDVRYLSDSRTFATIIVITNKFVQDDDVIVKLATAKLKALGITPVRFAGISYKGRVNSTHSESGKDVGSTSDA